jgi:hypothetical protein
MAATLKLWRCRPVPSDERGRMVLTGDAVEGLVPQAGIEALM